MSFNVEGFTESNVAWIITAILTIFIIAIVYFGILHPPRMIPKMALITIQKELEYPVINFSKADLSRFAPRSRELLSVWCERRKIDKSLYTTIAELLGTDTDFVREHCYVTNTVKELTDIKKRPLHDPTVLAIIAKKNSLDVQKVYVYIKCNNELLQSQGIP